MIAPLPRCADPARQLATDWQAETRLRSELDVVRARTGASIAALRSRGWSWRHIGAVMPASTARDRHERHLATEDGVAA